MVIHEAPQMTIQMSSFNFVLESDSHLTIQSITDRIKMSNQFINLTKDIIAVAKAVKNIKFFIVIK